MTDDELIREIARRGDALWDNPRSRDDHGRYVFINEYPDHGNYIIPAALGYPVALLLWGAERRLARSLGRSYFCLLCHNPMSDPLVSCPGCGRVQSRLRPSPGGIFTRRCPRCPKGRWKTLGQYFRNIPGPLVCRDTETCEGCYQPHRIEALAGRYRARHFALMGSTVAAKHTAMAHLFCQLVDGSRSREIGLRPAWKLSELELDLCRQCLCKAYRQDTGPCEMPGRRYGLARSFILKGNDGTLRVFHNLLNEWLEAEARVYENSLTWEGLTGLIFILDGDRLEAARYAAEPPPSEYFERAFRVIEKACRLAPGSRLPMKVAVVVAFSESDVTGQQLGSARSLPPALARELVLRDAPSLHALIQRTVAPSRLGYWGGVFPDTLELSKTGWMIDLIEWIA